jgi:predicted nucleic acid-binding protein
MKPEYLVDTSVWIPYFRESGSTFGELLDELIEEDRVHINGIIIAELLVGARGPVEIDRLSSALAGLKFVPSGRASFEAAGRNGYALRKKGVSVPLTDIIIATDCVAQGLVLMEADKHYATIAAHLPLRRHTSE